MKGRSLRSGSSLLSSATLESRWNSGGGGRSWGGAARERRPRAVRVPEGGKAREGKTGQSDRKSTLTFSHKRNKSLIY